MTDTALDAVRTVYSELSDWLMNEALPIWYAFGIDRVNGGFHEVVGLRCEIDPAPRRVRVTARQIFTFALAGRLGWTGPWKRAVTDGLDYFLDKCLLPNGAVRMVTHADGSPKDDAFCLYDQAFALFALAAAASVLDDRSAVEAAALKLRTLLLTEYKNPIAGFEEANPRTLPLKANPHMHTFEACMAWEEVGGDAVWTNLADEVAGLCLGKLIDPRQGWLKEFFDGDWNLAEGEPGRICEPGHHFEWAWLLTRWGRSRQRPDAIAAARRLVELGETYGVDVAEDVAIMELYVDGSRRDPTARLWSQTERIKGNLLIADVATDPETRDRHLALVVRAARALQRFFEVDTPGLWRDRMFPDGTFKIEPAPASTFYHIICAIDELRAFLARH
jgi:mannose/cellobiose epimerase-like protein (N-acyl-D-glucosamine 2-epimerase family)